MRAKLQAHVGIDALSRLFAVILKAVLPITGRADVVVRRRVHIPDLERRGDSPAGHLAADKSETAADCPHLEGGRVVSGSRHAIDGASHRVGAIPECVRPFVNFDSLVREKIDGFKIRKSVRISEIDAVDQDIDAAMVKIVPQRRAADLKLSLIRSVPGLKSNAGSELQHVLEIQCPRLHDFFLWNEDTAGGSFG